MDIKWMFKSQNTPHIITEDVKSVCKLYCAFYKVLKIGILN